MTKNLKIAALMSGLALGALAGQPALAAKKDPAPAATAEGGTVVPGVGVANFDAVIVNSTAYKTAETQRETTYKPQLDQAKARGEALNAQMRPLIEKFQTDQQGGKVTEAALQQQAAAIQALRTNGQRELQGILAPVSLSQAYVQEQIEDKLNDAVKNAMKKKSVSLLLSPEAILAMNGGAYNLNQDILTELDAAIPTAQLVPPAGWEPRQMREARAAQAGAQGGAPAPAAGAAPAGR